MLAFNGGEWILKYLLLRNVNKGFFGDFIIEISRGGERKYESGVLAFLDLRTASGSCTIGLWCGAKMHMH